MDPKIIMAVAGAGKTYTICNNLDTSSKSLIIAFTNQNIFNIKNELLKKYKSIPENIKVMTFDSFVYRLIIQPYYPRLVEQYEYKSLKLNGITLKTPPPMRITKIDASSGKKVEFNNPFYIKDSFLGHYVYNNEIFCSRMTKFCLKKNKKTLKFAIQNLKLFFDEIFIDEFQDFRLYNYDFIIYLAKTFKNTTLVGDYFQHSVIGLNKSGKPFSKTTDYSSYISKLCKDKFIVDCETLSTSRRCSEDICNFVKVKLRINILSAKINRGKVIWISTDNAKDILNNDGIVKLIYNSSRNYFFNSCNWGYSKGDTYNKVCVILTKEFENMDNNLFKFSGSGIVKNSLYVALTRTKSDLYLMKKSVFDIYKNSYKCK